MALTTSQVLISDTIQTLRLRFNELLAELSDFSFDVYGGNLTFAEDLTISGNIYSGEEYLYLNSGETGTGVAGGNAGLRIDRGLAADAILRFDETDDLWKVGLDAGSFTAISLTGHTHDDRYYTDSEVNALLANYYTSSQIDTLMTSYYTSSQVDTLLLGYPAISNSLTGTPKVFMYQGNVEDDAAVALPAITSSGFGWVLAGDAEEYSQFIIDAYGRITLINQSDKVVANADTDTMLCIGEEISPYEPSTIKNRLGATKNLNIVLWYD